MTRLPPESREGKNYSVEPRRRKTSYAKFGWKVPETLKCRKLPVHPRPGDCLDGGTATVEKNMRMKNCDLRGRPVYLTKGAARFHLSADGYGARGHKLIFLSYWEH